MYAFRLTIVAALSALIFIAQNAHADPSLMRAQVRAELVQVKVNGPVSFGELEYPPSIIDSDAAITRVQGKASLTSAEDPGLSTSGERDYPLVANRSPGQFEIEDTSDTLGIIINFNGNGLWNL